MIDKERLYLQEPEIIKKDNLIKILTNINGNQFNADDYKDGFELTIYYIFPGLRVIDYKIKKDDFERKYWEEIKKREFVPDREIIFCGKWKEGWNN